MAERTRKAASKAVSAGKTAGSTASHRVTDDRSAKRRIDEYPPIFEQMRGLYTPVVEVRRKAFAALARFVIDGRPPEQFDHLPFEVLDMRRPLYRCCPYRELSVLRQRLRLAMGLTLVEEQDNVPVSQGIEAAFTPDQVIEAPLVHVIRAACEKCAEDRVEVTDACHRCMAHPCVPVCPVDAVRIGPQRAEIDHDRCVRCGRCILACPYHAITRLRRPCAEACGVDAIGSDEDGFATIDHDGCVSCGLCIVSCPFGAIADKSEIVQVLLALRRAERAPVVAIVAPSFVGQFGRLVGPEVFFEGLRRLGFSDAMEVAYGADCDTLQLAERLAGICCPEQQQEASSDDGAHGPPPSEGASGDDSAAFLGTSCCPSWVLTARRFFPELAAQIAESYTPMVETAKKIKERRPEARVVFIGPCIAKKGEALTEPARRWVDHVLTFEELAAMYVASRIDLTALQDGEAVQDASGLGRGYALAGGVAEAIIETTQQRYDVGEVPFLRAETLRDCRAMLQELSRGAGEQVRLVEGMACPGGCIGGPGTLLGLRQAARDVQRFVKAAPRRLPTCGTADEA